MFLYSICILYDCFYCNWEPVVFQSLFQCDQILYTIVPVSGMEDLERAYMENSEGVCTIKSDVFASRTVLLMIMLIGFIVLFKNDNDGMLPVNFLK